MTNPPADVDPPWRYRAAWITVAAALGALAAGVVDIPSFLGSLTPRQYPTAAAYVVADQIRWGAAVGVAVALLALGGSFIPRLGIKLRALVAASDDVTFTLAVFGVAVALRAGYACAAAPPPISDEIYYLGLARAILQGSYTWGGAPTAYWPVGYPAFLAPWVSLSGGSYLGAVVAQVLLGGATAVVVYRWGRLLVGEAGGRGAALAVAALPSQVAYAARLFPAVPFTFLFLVAAYLAAARPSAAAAGLAGLAAGIATLMAPVAALFPAGVLAGDVLKGLPLKKICARAAAGVIGMTLVVAPWTYRNYQTFGEFVLISTNGGVNLWVGNNPKATGTYYYPTSRTNPVFNTRGELRRDKVGASLARYFIRHYPNEAALLLIPKTVYLFGADVSAFQLSDIGRGWRPELSARRVPARVAQGAYGALLVCAAVSLWRRRRFWFSREGGWPLIWGGLWWLVYLPFFGQDRFHFPAVPFIAILAGGLLKSEKTDAGS